MVTRITHTKTRRIERNEGRAAESENAGREGQKSQVCRELRRLQIRNKQESNAISECAAIGSRGPALHEISSVTKARYHHGSRNFSNSIDIYKNTSAASIMQSCVPSQCPTRCSKCEYRPGEDFPRRSRDAMTTLSSRVAYSVHQVVAIPQATPSPCVQPPLPATTTSPSTCCIRSTEQIQPIQVVPYIQPQFGSSAQNAPTPMTAPANSPVQVLLVPSTSYSYDTVRRVRYRGSGGQSRRNWYVQRNQLYRPGRGRNLKAMCDVLPFLKRLDAIPVHATAAHGSNIYSCPYFLGISPCGYKTFMTQFDVFPRSWRTRYTLEIWFTNKKTSVTLRCNLSECKRFGKVFSRTTIVYSQNFHFSENLELLIDYKHMCRFGNKCHTHEKSALDTSSYRIMNQSNSENQNTYLPLRRILLQPSSSSLFSIDKMNFHETMPPNLMSILVRVKLKTNIITTQTNDRMFNLILHDTNLQEIKATIPSTLNVDLIHAQIKGVGSIPTRRIFEVRFFAWCGRACARGGAGTTQKEDPGYVISLRSGKKPRSLYELEAIRITISRSPRRGLTKLAIDGAQHSHDEVRSENHTHKRAPDAGAKAQLERMMAPEARTTLTR
ncbi:unnamed protein product [Trichogramma brassicae]|uniref:Uncharacterized protein n=1 Tax=Trichogramma brassicae TaxID=86971 RepID=A0A6H5IQ63_9HYME|nr:unnamed protein product [Trichogramma brassicae]